MPLLLWILRHTRAYLVTTSLLALACAWWTVDYLESGMLAAYEARGLQAASFAKLAVEAQTSRSRLLGVLGQLADSSEDLHRLVNGEWLPDHPRVSALLESLRGQFDTENAFVVSQRGVIIAYSSRRQEVRGVGRNVAFRPYFLAAMAGKASIYPAVGVNSNDRGVYLAVPIRVAGHGPSGVLAVKLAMPVLDTLLRNWVSGPAALVSPQGVVFASNQEAWVLNVLGTLSEERLLGLRKYQQFGKMDATAPPEVLPFDFGTASLVLEGKNYRVQFEGLEFNDPLGAWQLMVMEQQDVWFSYATRGLIASCVVVLIAALAVCLLMYARCVQSRRTSVPAAIVAEVPNTEVVPESVSKLAAAEGRPELAADPILPVVPEETGVPHIPSLDTRQGLKNVMGKLALYEDILGKFSQTQHDVLLQMQASGERGDWLAVQRLAHTLKGVAATIGSAQIRALAAGIEEHVRHTPDAVWLEGQLKQLAAQLQVLIDEIHRYLAGKARSVEAVSESVVAVEEDVGPLLESLRHLLQEGDPEAAELVQAHHQAFARLLGDQQTPLQLAVEQFDFESALAILDQLAQRSEG